MIQIFGINIISFQAMSLLVAPGNFNTSAVFEFEFDFELVAFNNYFFSYFIIDWFFHWGVLMIAFVVAISDMMIVIITYVVIRECIEGFSNELWC